MTLKGRIKILKMTHLGMKFIIAGINIYTQCILVFRCYAHVRPGRRRQHLILVTTSKVIIQLVFKEGNKKKKQTVSRTYDPGMKSPLLSQLS